MDNTANTLAQSTTDFSFISRWAKAIAKAVSRAFAANPFSQIARFPDSD
jgi:hypothetical protein